MDTLQLTQLPHILDFSYSYPYFFHLRTKTFARISFTQLTRLNSTRPVHISTMQIPKAKKKRTELDFLISPISYESRNYEYTYPLLFLINMVNL